MNRTRDSACIGCGDAYQFTNRYKGNYCPDCHDSWSSRRPKARRRPRPMRARTIPSVRRIEEDDEHAPSRYDTE